MRSEALERLVTEVGRYDRMIVAFSGGVDSGLLAYAAHQALGDKALAVTAVSPSLPAWERDACAQLAADWGMAWREVSTDETENAAYTVNNGDRCFHCKTALMDALVPVQAAHGGVTALGVNLDDLGDHRPGQAAARERHAVFPLVDAAMEKTDVRAVAAELGLEIADKPAAACLASRVPYGEPVTVPVLGRIERAEGALRLLGFDELRVRHYRDLARIEVPLERLDAVLGLREQVVSAVRDAGYRYVTLDLDGLRSGNLNQALGLDER